MTEETKEPEDKILYHYRGIEIRVDSTGQYTVQKRSKIKTGDNAGEDSVKSLAYFSSLPQAVKFIAKTVADNEATSLNEWVEHASNVLADIEEILSL